MYFASLVSRQQYALQPFSVMRFVNAALQPLTACATSNSSKTSTAHPCNNSSSSCAALGPSVSVQCSQGALIHIPISVYYGSLRTAKLAARAEKHHKLRLLIHILQRFAAVHSHTPVIRLQLADAHHVSCRRRLESFSRMAYTC